MPSVADQMAGKAPASTPTTATAPKSASPKQAAPAVPKPATVAQPKSVAPKAPSQPQTPPPAPPSGAPLTTAYAQSYPEGMSAADFSYDDLGQSDASDIAPFEEYPTSRTLPSEGALLYRERMPGPEKPVVQPSGEQAGIRSPAQYGLPAKVAYPSPPRPMDTKESTEFWYGPRGGFQSVAEFRDYALGLGAALNEAERATDAASRKLESAARDDTTQRSEMRRLYDEQVARLRDVATLRERLRRVGFAESDIPTVRAHAEFRNED